MTPTSSNMYRYPPIIVSEPYSSPCEPIAFIVNGELTFCPFILITFPSQVIAVV